MKLADIVAQTGDTLVSLTKTSATLAEVAAKAADAFAMDALASVEIAHMGNQIALSGIALTLRKERREQLAALSQEEIKFLKELDLLTDEEMQSLHQ